MQHLCVALCVFFVCACGATRPLEVPTIGVAFVDVTPVDVPTPAPYTGGVVGRGTAAASGDYVVFGADGARMQVYKWIRELRSLVREHRMTPTGLPMALRDLDNDGQEDLVVSYNWNLMVYWSWKTSFDQLTRISGVDAVSISFADLNRDGLPDLQVSGQCGDDRTIGGNRLFYQVTPRQFLDKTLETLSTRSCASGYAIWAGVLHGVETLALINGKGEGNSGRPNSGFPLLFTRSDENQQWVPMADEPVLRSPDYPPTYEEFRQMAIAHCAPPNPAPDCNGRQLTEEEMRRIYREDGVDSLTARDPMGAFFADADGDGKDDVILTVHSNTHMLRSRSGRLIDETFAAGLTLKKTTNDPIPWGITCTDLNRDGWCDLVTTYGNDGDAWRTGLIGPQVTEIQLGIGGGMFSKPLVNGGVERLGQWEGLAVADINGDGAPDLVVTGQAEAARVYINTIENGRTTVGIRPRKTRPPRHGGGARIRVDAPGLPTQYLVVDSMASPRVTSEPVVFAGLGFTDTATVVITWPSGVVQEFRLSAGTTHQVIEE